MKYIKIVLIISFAFLLTGCFAKEESKVLNQKEIYLSYVKQIHKVDKTTKIGFPFDIDIKYDKLTKDEIRYQVIIDNPKTEIKDVSAIVVHDKPTDDIFPSTGIFEEKQNLIPGKKPSGIILVGYIPYSGKVSDFECNMKVMIKYTCDNKKEKVYYVTKKDK